MKEIIKFIINHWYYFIVALLVTKTFKVNDWYSALIIPLIIAGCMGMNRIQWKIIDFIILLSIIYGIISVFFSIYDIHLYYWGVKMQLSVMMFYYIGRSNVLIPNNFVDNIKWPMFFFIISGIILYFFPPNWYLDYRYANVKAVEGSVAFYEHTRMSSFAPHPYFLGYGSCFFIIFVIKKIVIDHENKIINFFFLFVSFFTLFFSQMRVAIFYVLIISTLILTLFLFKKRRGYYIIVLFLGAGILLLTIILQNLDSDFLYYILQRTSEHKGNIAEERFDMYSRFYKYISVFGYGLGRFGHEAFSMGLPYISDNEYIRLLCEQGIVGFVLIISPILYAILLGFKNIRNNFFETISLAFFPIAMIGATPLEVLNQHSFLIWYCVGRIIKNKNIIKNERSINHYCKL